MSLDDLSGRLGHRFEDTDLLDRALAHRSWCAEHGGAPSNERLEFLGDAVLGWVIADLAFRRFADVPEGRLTDLRKSVVNEAALAEVAAGIGLGEFVKLGKGEAAGGGAGKPTIKSDTLEAVLGAVYLDGGAEVVFGLVERLVGPRLADSVVGLGHRDHKTELQEQCARLGRGAPRYELTSTGPDHAKEFSADVSVDGILVGRGSGSSKKMAEQAAASEALAALD